MRRLAATNLGEAAVPGTKAPGILVGGATSAVIRPKFGWFAMLKALAPDEKVSRSLIRMMQHPRVLAPHSNYNS